MTNLKFHKVYIDFKGLFDDIQIPIEINSEDKIIVDGNEDVTYSESYLNDYLKLYWSAKQYDEIHIVADSKEIGTATFKWTVKELIEMDKERDLLEGIPEEEQEVLAYRSIPTYVINCVANNIFDGLVNQALQNKITTYLKDKECPVLHEQLKVESTRVLSCDHLISEKAFKKLSKKSCPLCRKDQNAYVPFLQEVFKERFLDE